MISVSKYNNFFKSLFFIRILSRIILLHVLCKIKITRPLHYLSILIQIMSLLCSAIKLTNVVPAQLVPESTAEGDSCCQPFHIKFIYDNNKIILFYIVQIIFYNYMERGAGEAGANVVPAQLVPESALAGISVSWNQRQLESALAGISVSWNQRQLESVV